MLEELYNSIENLSARIKGNKSGAARGSCQSRRSGPLGRFVSCNKCHLSNSSRIYKICWIKFSLTHGQESPWNIGTPSKNIHTRSSQQIFGVATFVHGTNDRLDKCLMTLLLLKILILHSWTMKLWTMKSSDKSFSWNKVTFENVSSNI